MNLKDFHTSHEWSNGLRLSDDDIVNPSDREHYNGQLWIVTDHGFVVGAAFADCEGDALDEIADSGKLSAWLIHEEDREDYQDDSGLVYLGNHCHAYDLETIKIYKLIVPELTVCEMRNAAARRR